MYDLYLYSISRERARRDESFWQVWTGCNVRNQYAKRGNAVNPFDILKLKKPGNNKVDNEEVIEIEDIPGESKMQKAIRIAAVKLEKESREEVSKWRLPDFDEVLNG